MMSFSDKQHTYIIDAFNSTSRYLDTILLINNIYVNNMVSHIYPAELQSKKGGKGQESIQLSTTPDPGYHMGK